MLRSESRIQVDLAPMEGVSEWAMRLWLGLCSAPRQMTTPFLRATDTFPHKSIPADFAPETGALKGSVGYHLVPQVMASAIDPFKKSFELLQSDSPWVDLNCGCPAPKVVGHGAGSSLLIDPDKFARIIESLAEFCGPQRLSVKMRSGFDNDLSFDLLIDGIKNLPLKSLCVHARTRAQRYRGKARWELIEQAAQRCSFPVVGSGDLCTYQQISDVQSTCPSVHRWLIGRGALRNPWVFFDWQRAASSTLSFDCLHASLGVYVLLIEAQLHHQPRMFAWSEQGYFREPLFQNSAAWQSLLGVLADDLHLRIEGSTSQNFDRRSLGRLKMLWSYLRSSMDEAFMDPRLLRVRSVADFFSALTTVFVERYGDLQQMIALKYDARRDWIYAGEGRPDA